MLAGELVAVFCGGGGGGREEDMDPGAVDSIYLI